jgi:Sec-independent protein translocase protein TatA
MKKLIIIIACTLFCMVSFAQKPKVKLQDRIAGMKNFKKIMAEVHNYFEEEKEEKEREETKKENLAEREEGEEFESEELFWARWEIFYRSRLKPNGDIEDVTAKNIEAWESVNNTFNRGASSSSASLTGTDANWNPIGPFTNSHQAGSYRGLSRIDRIVFSPVNPNVIYAGAPNGGLWKSSDNGASWNNLTKDFPINAVAGIAISPFNPSKIYVITGDANIGSFLRNNSCGIWVTYDDGINWFKTNFNNNGQNAATNGYKIMVDPTNDNIIFAACRNGFYRSADGGASWSLTQTGKIFDIEFDPSDHNRIYISSDDSIFVSTNNGVSFPSTVTVLGAVRIELAVSAANSNYVYALLGGFRKSNYSDPTNPFDRFAGVFRSTNKGLTFNSRGNSPNILSDASNGVGASSEGDQSDYDLVIEANPLNAEELYFGGKIVWRSVDGAATFTNVTSYAEGAIATPGFELYTYVHPDIHEIKYNTVNGYLYIGTDGGMYRSNSNGPLWEDLTHMQATTFYHMSSAAYDANKIGGGTQDNGIKFKKDAGDFTHIKGGDGFYCSFANTATIGMYATGNSNLYRFDNNGNSVAISNPFRTGFFPIILANPVNSNIVYMASGPTNTVVGTGVRKSFDKGITWNVADSLYPTVPGIVNLAISPNNQNRVYLLTNTALVRTDNADRIWTSNLTLNPGFTATDQFTDVAVCPTNSDQVYVTIGGYTAGQKVFCSNDAGVTWINISGSLPAAVKVNCAVVDNFNNVYIGTDMGVYYQAVSSNDWTPFYNNLPRVIVSELNIQQSSGVIRAATYGRGIWQTNLFTTCDPNFNLTGFVYGEKFYQTSNTITSNAYINGGNTSNVITKAGNEIVLSDGFTVPEANRYLAVIGACETGPVNTNANNARASNNKKDNGSIPIFMHSILKGDSTAVYPYGIVSISYDEKNKKTLLINALKDGAYQVNIVDASEINKVEPITLSLKANENITKDIEQFNLPKGKFYAQLYFENKLVHVQELFIDN